LDAIKLFFKFAAMIGLCLPIVYIILPETKNLSFDMIQKYFVRDGNQAVFYDVEEVKEVENK